VLKEIPMRRPAAILATVLGSLALGAAFLGGAAAVAGTVADDAGTAAIPVVTVAGDTPWGLTQNKVNDTPWG
jgi:hypothetical protein